MTALPARKPTTDAARFVLDLEYDGKTETHIFTREQFREEFSWGERERLLWNYERDMPAKLERMGGAFTITLRRIVNAA